MSNEEAGNLRLLDTSYRKDVDMIKIGANNTYEHEMAKAKICLFLKKNKRHFVTEAILKNQMGRIDVFDITNSIAYEVVMTEKGESIQVKKDKYPIDLVELNAIDILETIPDNLYKYLN